MLDYEPSSSSQEGSAYNLFKLFFRASIFFLSTGTLEGIGLGPSFLRAAAAAPTVGSDTVGL
jgi:hypothetical protein